MKEFIEKLIKMLEARKKIILSHKIIDAEDESMIFAYNETINIVNQLAEEFATDINVVSNNGWIPCSERLPEKATTYEVTEEVVVNSKKLYIVEHRIFGTEGEWLLPSNRKVIAWMPLPQPFKEEGE